MYLTPFGLRHIRIIHSQTMLLFSSLPNILHVLILSIQVDTPTHFHLKTHLINIKLIPFGH